jgi:hypothetical protein
MVIEHAPHIPMVGGRTVAGKEGQKHLFLFAKMVNQILIPQLYQRPGGR